MMRRRWLRLTVVFAALGVAFAMVPEGTGGADLSDRRPPVGTIYQVAPRLYVVPDGGGNTAVFITATGVVLVDTKFSENWYGLLAQVRSVTDKPITHVINTHAHGDHSGGDIYLDHSVEIDVQANTAANMRTLDVLPRPGNTLPPIVRTFVDRMTLLSGDDAIDLYWFGPAHTDGDALVVFRAARVMHAGDVFPGRVTPIANIEFGGNGVGLAHYLTEAARTIPDVDRVITGHGVVEPWKAFVDYGRFVSLLVDYVRANMHWRTDKNRVFKALTVPEDFRGYDLSRSFDTLDEIDRSIRPWWMRVG
jgi:glyoxylase-like metal-dependent hydrolase (beta-lactamase superfamily II)